MPLTPGSSRETISHNIEEMVNSGHPQKQAVAAALSNARKTSHDKIARDMTSENWKMLRWLLGKFFSEEQHEPEHQGSEREQFYKREQPGLDDDALNSAGSLAAAKALKERGLDQQTPSSTTPNTGTPAPVAKREDDTEDELSSHGALKAATALHKRGLDESEETKKHHEGELSETTREKIGEVGSEKREDMPDDVFLMPEGKKYPVKTKVDGEWKLNKNLLLAAARRARMNHEEGIATRADEIRERDFGGEEEKKEAHDALAMDFKSKRTFDSDGRMRVEDSIISRACVSPYWGHEIPDYEKLGLDPQKQYQLLRDPEELRTGLKSFESLPIMDRHIPVSADKPNMSDAIGATGTDVKFDGENLISSLKFWTKDAIDAIQGGGRSALSCAYRYNPVKEPGVYKGQAYDIRMKNIEANHLALVDKGRVPGACVADSVSGFDDQWGVLEKAILSLAA